MWKGGISNQNHRFTTSLYSLAGFISVSFYKCSFTHSFQKNDSPLFTKWKVESLFCLVLLCSTGHLQEKQGDCSDIISSCSPSLCLGCFPWQWFLFRGLKEEILIGSIPIDILSQWISQSCPLLPGFFSWTKRFN